MNPSSINSPASAATKKDPQEQAPIVARESFLSKRSPKLFFALIVCPILALLGFSPPSLALAITSVVPSNGVVTVKWTTDSGPYQLQKSTDLVKWEAVDTETSATTL